MKSLLRGAVGPSQTRKMTLLAWVALRWCPWRQLGGDGPTLILMMRRTIALVVAAAALAAGFATAASAKSVCTGTCFAAPAGSGPLLVFTGHGWGHGVGMSQYLSLIHISEPTRRTPISY